MHIRNNADDREQPQVAIHVPEFNRVADRVLAGPAFARQRVADQGHMRRFRPIPLIE